MTVTNKVLVVDDNAAIREWLGDLIRECKCEPVLTSTAVQALNALGAHAPIASFVDLYMPDHPGDVCCKMIKSKSGLANVPVVLMTATDSQEEIERAFFAGADDFLPKPVRPHQLASKLKAIREGLSSMAIANETPTSKWIDGAVGTQRHIERTVLDLDRVLSRVSALLSRDGRVRTPGGPFYQVCQFRGLGQEDWLSGFIYTLSSSGVAVRTLTPLPERTSIEVQFTLDPEVRLLARALVVWANPFNERIPGGDRSGMGLRFESLEIPAQKWIDSFLYKAPIPNEKPTSYSRQ